VKDSIVWLFGTPQQQPAQVAFGEPSSSISRLRYLDKGLRPDDEGDGGEGVDDGNDEERIAEDGDAGVDDSHDLRVLGGGSAEEVLDVLEHKGLEEVEAHADEEVGPAVVNEA